MAAVVSVATFERAFMRKGISIATLKRTIRNSQIRLNANLSPAAEQTEINRIQAAANALEKRGTFSQKVAANALEKRGTFSQKVAAKVAHKEVEKRSSIRPFLRKHQRALAVGGIALLLVGALVAK